MTPKLIVGDIIEVHGYVMLQKLEGGQKYKVAGVITHNNHLVYQFTKARGTKIIVSHYVHEVDMWIKNYDNNRIVLVKRA